MEKSLTLHYLNYELRCSRFANRHEAFYQKVYSFEFNSPPQSPSLRREGEVKKLNK
jgi:hypothetical protein